VTGLTGRRVYLDWNATAPLRPEARAAMLAAMDVVGNPSSVHAEGRAAKAIVEKARGQVARLVRCAPDEVVFTSGATEAARHVVGGNFWGGISLGPHEHDAVNGAAFDLADASASDLNEDLNSRRYELEAKFGREHNWTGSDLFPRPTSVLVCLQHSNGETGCIELQDVAHVREIGWKNVGLLRDITQSAGKRGAPYATLGERDDDGNTRFDFKAEILSAHKFGGPTGVGAAVLLEGSELKVPISGGGQEQGRRSGTENVIGIAGFGAAAEAAERDLEAGVWYRVAKLRDDLEERLASAASDLHIFGKEAPRLPNTSCFAVPGWTGETQVMQMDLAGFAVSAGSACSSGKVSKASRVLLAMGFDEVTASSAIRVSMGPTTTEAEVMAFADTWTDHYRRRKDRAA
jgi:cysteine desulfurase